MSSNEPPLAVQRRRHAGPLIGIAVILIIVGAAFVWWMGYEVEEGTQPQGAGVQMDAPLTEGSETQGGGADGAILDAGSSNLQPTREDEISPTTPAAPEETPALETTP